MSLLLHADPDSDCIPKKDSAEIWKQTSKWRQYQLGTLKLKYVDACIEEIIGRIDIYEIELSEDAERLLLPGIDIQPGQKVSLSNKQRKFYNRVIQLYRFPDEPSVDSIARDLLDYEGEDIHFRPKPKMRMS